MTGAASGAPRAALEVRILLIGDALGRWVRLVCGASGAVSARRSVFGSAARPTPPRADPGSMTIGGLPGASTSRNGAHFRQAPSTRFQQSAQQDAPQVRQPR